MDIKSFDKDLPDTTKEITLEVVGSVTKKKFVGEFTCKIPNMEDQVLIAKAEANANGQYPMYLDSGVLKLNKMHAYLKYTIIGIVPKFWQESKNGIQLRDMNVIEELYNKVLAFEEEWIKKVWGEVTDEPEKVEETIESNNEGEDEEPVTTTRSEEG